ncbi:hypothetical protein [Spirulina subsalsa]|uniref:hypothetical protein n=1 Tax=Spirulina subsalsa TaxID=54311 RepID=UPI0003088751|nr:hypothetical protein [Spirulina subsalsa]
MRGEYWSSSSYTYPQIGEVQAYFANRWQPPETLNQPVEYHIWIDGDGSLKRFRPMNNQAQEVLAQTGMPSLGSSFVSPVADNRTLQLRVIFSTNGTVRTDLVTSSGR